MNHFLLVNPSTFWSRWAESAEARAHLSSLYSYLRRNNPSTRIDYVNLKGELGYPQTYDEIDTFLEAAEALLREHELDVIGLSCWTSVEYQCTLALASLCKRINPRCKVVVGGYHPSIVPEDFIFAGAPIDYVVRGEGELALSELLRSTIERPDRPELIQGRPLLMADEVLLVDDNPVFQDGDGFSAFLSRGCPFVCKFCIEGNLPQTAWRAHSPEQALALVDAVAASGRFRTISFNDPIFGVGAKWRRAFLAGLAERDHDLTYWAETRHDLLDREDVELLARLEGRFTLDLGLDGASLHILDVMKKAKSPTKYLERFLHVDDLMNRHRLFHTVYLIVNYPGETSASIDEAKEFFRRLFDSREQNYTFVGGAEFFLTPGCDVWDNLDDYRRRYGFEHFAPWWWKLENCDHYRQARMVVPSRSLLAEGRLAYGREALREIALRSRRDMPSDALKRARDPEEIYPKRLDAEPRERKRALARGDELFESFRLTLASDAKLSVCGDESYLVNMNALAVSGGDSHEGVPDSVNRVKVLTADASQVVERLAAGTDLEELVSIYGEGNRSALAQLLSDLLADQLLEIADRRETADRGSVGDRSTSLPDLIVRTSRGALTVSLSGTSGSVQARWFHHLARLGALDDAGVDLSSPGRVEAEIPDQEAMEARVRLGVATRVDHAVCAGTVALGRVNATAFGAKWLVAVEDQPEWSRRYALVGRVHDVDLPILHSLEPGDRIESVRAAFAEPVPEPARSQIGW